DCFFLRWIDLVPAVAPRLVERDAYFEEEDADTSFAAGVPWVDAGELSREVNPHDRLGAFAQREARFERGDELKRVELEQHVVPHEAIHVETGRLGVQLRARTELH